MEKFIKTFQIGRNELLFLGLIYLAGLFCRLLPKLFIDPHLLTMNADVWERLAMAQYFLDFGHLPKYCLRYAAYGNVPFWYPPLSPISLAILAKISSFDLATVCSRIIPFLEAFTPLSFYFLSRRLFGRSVGYLSTTILALTPSFIYWTGITTPTSLTLFLLPIYIILLLERNERRVFPLKLRLLWIAATSGLLAINFLTHLTYFFAVLILLIISLLLFLKSESQGKKFLDFFVALLLSQLITAAWWAPQNLYWWWIFGLTTSSGLEAPMAQLKNFGVFAGAIGIIAGFIYLPSLLVKARKTSRLDWLALAWIVLPFIETQNEFILKIFNRLDLSWQTIFKPLEGYRFYCFLAQPLALIAGWLIAKYLLIKENSAKLILGAALIVLSLALTLDIVSVYKITERFQNSGITLAEYQAASWFHKNSAPDDRIIADYYRSQMFAGVCAGKTLLGGLFPLRNVKLPYIGIPSFIQSDIYTIYNSSDPQVAVNLMRRYKSDCLFISPTLISVGYLGAPQSPGFGIKVERGKFEDQRYFRKIYSDSPGVEIFKIRDYYPEPEISPPG